MYRVGRRINYADGMVVQDTTKCDLPQEAVAWINKMIGKFAPINRKNEDRILDMLPGEKIKFMMCDISVSVRCI